MESAAIFHTIYSQATIIRDLEHNTWVKSTKLKANGKNWQSTVFRTPMVRGKNEMWARLLDATKILMNFTANEKHANGRWILSQSKKP